MDKDNKKVVIITKQLEKTKLFKRANKSLVWKGPLNHKKKENLLNAKEIQVYDITKNTKEEAQKTFNVNDHVNKSGENPLIKKNKKIEFIDMTGAYDQKPRGVTTISLGKKYYKENQNHKFPSTDIANISIYIRSIKPKIKIKGFLINCLIEQ